MQGGMILIEGINKKDIENINNNVYVGSETENPCVIVKLQNIISNDHALTDKEFSEL